MATEPLKSLATALQAVWVILVILNDQIAMGTEQGTIKIIDLNDQSKTKIKEKAHDHSISCLLQLSNGNLASAGIDTESSAQMIKLWKLADMSLLQAFKTNHN